MAKFKMPRKPKAPRASASTATHNNFHQRIKEWEKKCRAVETAKKAHETAVKKSRALAGKR